MNIKKQILTALALVTVAAAAVTTAGANQGDPGTGIVNSPHDMRMVTGGPATDAYNRVCAFCHTPHHSQLPQNPDDYYPLWSRQIDNTTFQPYVSSTMNSADYNADIAVGPTRLCMSCHDGSIAVDQHYGTSSGSGKILLENGYNSPGVGQGATSLTNDHPVGMNYYDVAVGPATGSPTQAQVAAAQFNQDPWIRQVDDTLVYKNNAYGVKVGERLYVAPSDPTKAYMTCATCHDVHNRKNADLPGVANYLVLAPQNNSDLCLTCHIK